MPFLYGKDSTDEPVAAKVTTDGELEIRSRSLAEIPNTDITPEVATVATSFLIIGTTNSGSVSHAMLAINAATDAAAGQALLDRTPNVHLINAGLTRFPIPHSAAITSVHVIGVGSTSATGAFVVAAGSTTLADYTGAQKRFDIDGAEACKELLISTSPLTDFGTATNRDSAYMMEIVIAGRAAT